MKQAITVENLTVTYDRAPVLWDIDLEIPEGVLLAIVGPNGAGKSTFIKAILELLKPISGRVAFFNQPYKSLRKKIAYVPQRGSVDWDFPTTVIDVVMMGRYGHLGWFKRPKKEDIELSLDALKQVGMSEFKDRQISELSGGQQQRVFLARALVQDAEIYMMDEPFQGVDIKTEQAIVQLLKRLNEQGKTIIVVHHDLNTVTNYFDWVTFLNRVIVAHGPVKEVFTKENIEKTYRNPQLNGGGW